MSGFTKEEIAAEQERRRRANGDSTGTLGENGGGTHCMHCGTPMPIWEATDADFPLCDTCLYDD